MVRRPKNSSPKMAVNIGTAPLRSPVTAELMCCSARGNSVKGMPTQMIDKASMWTRSSGRRRSLEPGRMASVTAPNPTRSNVMTPGSRLSSPMAMKQERRAPDQPDRREDRPVLRREGRRGRARRRRRGGRRGRHLRISTRWGRDLRADLRRWRREDRVEQLRDGGRRCERTTGPARSGAGPTPRTTARAPAR